MHLFGVMYDLVDHVVTSQYFSEQRCKTPEQNSKLSPTYRKRAASCDSVGLFQVNIGKLCSNLLHPCWYSVCWSINYRGNLLKIPALTVDFFLPPFKAVSFHSIYLKPQPVHPIFAFPSELTLLSCVAASGAAPFRISLCLIQINFLGWCFLGFSFLSFVVVQSLSCVQLFAMPGTAASQAPLSSLSPGVCSNSCPLSWWCHSTISSCLPLLLLPSIFSSIRVFSNESALHIRWPKYWRFSFSISPSNEYSGLTSFRIDWSDLLAVQGTLRSLIQHHNSKASILRCSAFFKFFALNLSVFLSVTHVIYKQQIFFEKQAGNPFFFP